MEALVSQDFEFNVLSKAYAEFLIECSNGYPDGRVERVPSGLYLHKDQNMIQVNFQSPESIAVFLKLKFGAFLRQRPEPKKDEDMYEQIRKLTSMYDVRKTYENKYVSDLKIKKINLMKPRNEILEDYFFDVKNFDKEDYSE